MSATEEPPGPSAPDAHEGAQASQAAEENAGAHPEAGGDDALEALSTQELHDRAVSWAERHLDVKFFWRLLKAIPTAEAITGDEGEAEYDIQFSKGLISDALKSGEGALGEALRPLFIEYLRGHPGALK